MDKLVAKNNFWHLKMKRKTNYMTDDVTLTVRVATCVNLETETTFVNMNNQDRNQIELISVFSVLYLPSGSIE